MCAEVLQDAHAAESVILDPSGGVTFREAPVVQIPVIFQACDRAVDIGWLSGSYPQLRFQIAA